MQHLGSREGPRASWRWCGLRLLIVAGVSSIVLFGVLSKDGEVTMALSASDIGSRLMIGTASSASRPTPAPRRFVTRSIPADLTKLEGELPFPIWQPTYLPPGARLTVARRVTTADRGDDLGQITGIALHYSSPDGGFRLTETLPSPPMRLVVERARILGEVDIAGRRAVWTDPGGPRDVPVQARALLQWTDGARWFELQGTLDTDEMIKIARSLALDS